MWDIKNLFQIKMLSILKEHSKKISTLKFINDNLAFGSGSLDNIIFKLTTHLDQVLDLAFSSDGQQMATSSLDKRIIFWSRTNLDKPKIQMILQQQLGAQKIIYCPNKQILVSLYGQTSNEIKFWNSAEFNLISKIMISFSQDRILRIWKINQQCLDIDKQIKIDEGGRLYKVYYQNSQNIIAHIGFNVYQLEIQLNNPQKKKFSLFVSQNNKIIAIANRVFNRIEIIVIENFNNNTNIHFEEKNYIKDFLFSPDSSLLAIATNKGAFIQNIITSQILQNFQVSKCFLLICFLGKDQLAIVLSGQLVLYDIKDLQQTKLLSLWQTCQNNSKLNYQYLIIEKYQEMQFLIQKKFIGMGIGQDIQFISLENTIPVEKIFYLIEQNYHVGYYYQNFSSDSNILSILTANLIYFQLEICSNKILKQINFNKFNSKFCALNQQETMKFQVKTNINNLIQWNKNYYQLNLKLKKQYLVLKRYLIKNSSVQIAFFVKINQILLQVIQIQELNYGILNLVNCSLTLKQILKEQICLQFQVEQYQLKLVIISQSYGIQKPQNSNNLKQMVILILLIKYVFPQMVSKWQQDHLLKQLDGIW
ncbi:unnamed protein product [Paramecium primaurelia]|uniref:Uncharacterized protein n=1 Tax=Paramecium primaurelia TaxID=5886 RepID=A0A8S1JUV3_PARPR|nr:unnamed protein product [Paramecium primaurelia]